MYLTIEMFHFFCIPRNGSNLFIQLVDCLGSNGLARYNCTLHVQELIRDSGDTVRYYL